MPSDPPVGGVVLTKITPEDEYGREQNLYCVTLYVLRYSARYLGFLDTEIAWETIQTCIDWIFNSTVRYKCVQCMRQVLDCIPDPIWPCIGAACEMVTLHGSKWSNVKCTVLAVIFNNNATSVLKDCPRPLQNLSPINHCCRRRTWSLENWSTLTKFYHAGHFTTPG
jgi:hypothetical protein